MKWENIFNWNALSLALLLCAVSSCRVTLASALCHNIFALPLVFPIPPECNKFFYWGKNENYITYWCSILEKFQQRALEDKSKEKIEGKTDVKRQGKAMERKLSKKNILLHFFYFILFFFLQYHLEMYAKVSVSFFRFILSSYFSVLLVFFLVFHPENVWMYFGG